MLLLPLHVPLFLALRPLLLAPTLHQLGQMLRLNRVCCSNHGATDAKLGIAEKLHAKHNEFAQMRNDLLLAGAQS